MVLFFKDCVLLTPELVFKNSSFLTASKKKLIFVFKKLPTEGIILNGGGKYPSNDLIKNSLDCSNLKELGDLVPRLYWNSSKAGLIK